MGIVILLFIIVGGSIAFSAWYRYKSQHASPAVGKHTALDDGSAERRCLACGYEGEMKTWIGNYKAPKFYFVLGFICGYLPGVIFLALYWGKYMCPNCGAVGKNRHIRDGQ
jgi:hypothetical protein